MAKKKKISEDEFLSIYMTFVEKNGRHPKNFSSFIKRNETEATSDLGKAKSFKEVDRYIFYRFLENTLALLERSEEYQDFSAQNKLLSFYYTYFELLSANKDYVSVILEQQSNFLTSLGVLKKYKKGFFNYVDSLPIETFELYDKSLNKVQSQLLRSAAWIQYVSLLKFWLSDRSTAYEKTDIFIEKVVNTSFDLINIKPILSVIDLGKFILKEKTTSKK